ncbi:MAG: hypothetical protein US60_C0009G0010 [Microgenomates group bacterium GW2011_GWC1_37_8]|uniref:Uncharacterized protein n=1 Tax=Candidatus Woesebacteria bacterium GW2011_GWB1_38_8 TaxID=1618570 RepID=A0A0G0LDE6_9BACT|nr:MAG: hypothetical protein US60_C0009G0010 [Microgenomates group bacterium GW2011_GWC1_37_8]KKQ85945.1 MAG: hypothetical protein UT08_C0003G0108 [Candidatus Woesebacteria bacterium GW2011_GWB1_38_8]
MTAELRDHYSKRPFTGVIIGPGGFNRETQNRIPGLDEATRTLVASCGKKCEQVQFQAWTGTLPVQPYYLFLDLADTVRARIVELKDLALEGIRVHSQQNIEFLKENLPYETELERKETNKIIKREKQRINFSRNSDSIPIYLALTSPPTTLEDGTVRDEPDWPPLAELFQETDQLFKTNLMAEFAKLDEDNSGSGVVNGKLKFLVETALILSRIVGNQKNHNQFPGYEVVPNTWISNQVQFDGILLQKIEGKTEQELFEMWKSGKLPWWVVETKADFRGRFLFGEKLGRRVHNRHIEEMQIKLASLVDVNSGNYYLPQGIVFVYERGTEEQVFHHVFLNHSFLLNWRTGILLSLEGTHLTPAERDKSLKLLTLIDSRLNETIKEEEIQKQAANKFEELLVKIPSPFDQLKKHASNKIIKHFDTKDKGTKIPPFPLNTVKKMLELNRLGRIMITKLNFSGNSSDKIVKLVDHLAESSDFGPEFQDLQSKSAKFSDWVGKLLEDSTTDQLPTAILSPIGDLQQLYSSEGAYLGEYTYINAKSFLEIFGSQLQIHLTRKYRNINTVSQRELKMLRIMASKLQDRTLILAISEEKSDESRDILGINLLKKEA